MRLGDKLKKNFAKNLQTLRNRKDLTQAKLVDALNEKYKEYDIDLKRTSIVNYESEGAMPRIDALYCIAKYFDKTIDQMISPSMDKLPALTHEWMTGERSLEPLTNIETARQGSSAREGDAAKSGIPELDHILTTCVEGIIYRQFYVEFLKKLFQQLQDSAENGDEREKIGTMFYKTFLGCQISKSAYIQELAEKRLDKQEFSVFMAFKDHNTTISMVATGLEMTEEEVVFIFNRAQSKISSMLEGNSKSDPL